MKTILGCSHNERAFRYTAKKGFSFTVDAYRKPNPVSVSFGPAFYVGDYKTKSFSAEGKLNASHTSKWYRKKTAYRVRVWPKPIENSETEKKTGTGRRKNGSQ